MALRPGHEFEWESFGAKERYSGGMRRISDGVVGWYRVRRGEEQSSVSSWFALFCAAYMRNEVIPLSRWLSSFRL
jgi:hypothetical protein